MSNRKFIEKEVANGFLNVCLYVYLFMAVLDLHCCAPASRCSVFSCCRAWASGVQTSVTAAHGLSCQPVPCIGRQMECHWNDREVLAFK